VKNYEGKHFGLISENSNPRILEDKSFLALTGADTQKVEEKGKMAYNSKVHMVILAISNDDIEINPYNHAHVSRAYTMSMPRREKFSATAEEDMRKQIYMFRRYCQSIRDKWGKSIVEGPGRIKKPDDMVAYMNTHCTTYEAKAVRKYFKLCKKNDAKDTLRQEEVVKAICRLEEDLRPGAVRRVLNDAKDSEKVEWSWHIKDDEMHYTFVSKGKLV
jgi:hypothetical protein